MNCTTCQKELPENYSAVYCPFCGKDLAPEKAKLENGLSPMKFNPFLFLGALLLPPLLTLLSALAMRNLSSTHPTNEGLSALVGLIGGLVGGAVCGTLLGVKAGRTTPARVLLSLLLSAVMIVICVALCCFGCSLGGYQLRIGG